MLEPLTLRMGAKDPPRGHRILCAVGGGGWRVCCQGLVGMLSVMTAVVESRIVMII